MQIQSNNPKFNNKTPVERMEIGLIDKKRQLDRNKTDYTCVNIGNGFWNSMFSDLEVMNVSGMINGSQLANNNQQQGGPVTIRTACRLACESTITMDEHLRSHNPLTEKYNEKELQGISVLIVFNPTINYRRCRSFDTVSMTKCFSSYSEIYLSPHSITKSISPHLLRNALTISNKLLGNLLHQFFTNTNRSVWPSLLK